jgi:AcrR family transcriptional regulator
MAERTRTNRKESQARTRAAIVDAARRLFLEQGSTVTLERVAAEAGFTIGAVYSNFSGKDELLLAVLTDQSSGAVARAALVLEEPGVPLAAKLDAFVDAMLEHGTAEPGWVRLSADARSLAGRSPAFRQELLALQRANHQRLLDAAEAAWRAEGVEPPLPMDVLVETSLQIIEGVAARQLLDPTMVTRPQLRAAFRQLHGLDP